VVCLNPRANPGDPNTARPGFSISDAAGQSRLFVEQTSGSVGINTVTPAARLQVADGAIMPAPGSSKASGIQFPENAFGGSGDGAWIRYYARSGEGTTLEIGTSNEAHDHIALMATGNVGICTDSPSHKLHVRAENAVGLLESSGTDAYLRLSTREGLGNRVELANRPGGRLALWVGTGGDALNVLKDGKVGIGRTDPQRQLHVGGTCQISLQSGNSVANDSTAGIFWHTSNDDYAIFRTPGSSTASMIPFRYGAVSLRHLVPASELVSGKIRCFSAHSLTVRFGGGVAALAQAATMPPPWPMSSIREALSIR